MSDSINIRKADYNDTEILAYIHAESWKKGFKDILSKEDIDKYTDLNKVKEMYSMVLSKNIGYGLILTVNEKAHCIAFWSKTREENMEGSAEIICIHSLENNWNRGYGTIMIDYLLKEIKDKNFNKVMLWVFEENNRARKFYEKNGFVLSDKIKEFFNKHEVMYYKNI